MDMNDERTLFETGLERRSARERLTTLLGEQAIIDLHKRSDWMGWYAVVSCWVLIAALLAVATLSIQWMGWWSAPIVIACLFLLGGRILGLAILSHESSHRTLFENAKVNDFVGTWFCGAPIYLDLVKYRKHHAQHHVHTGTDKDTDLPLTVGFPTSKVSMMRKFFRDFTGLTGVKSLIGLALMNAGVLRWSVSGAAERLEDRPKTFSGLLRTFFIGSYRTLIFQAVFLALTIAIGRPEVFALWWAAYFFTYPFCIRVRSIAEHAVTERCGDMLKNTRTTQAGFLARALFAPYHVNLHIEHHALVSVPWWQLPKLHRLLQDRQALPEPPSYWEVMKLATAG